MAARFNSSDLAKELVADLHEPMKNEERWEISDKYLHEAWRIGFEAGYWVRDHIQIERPELLSQTSAEVMENLGPSEGLYAGSTPAPTTT